MAGDKPQAGVRVTGGMGGLGDSISTKMADAGYRVVVTYSPGNTKHGAWVADMKSNGYDIYAVACDVADIDSCGRAVAEVQDKVGAHSCEWLGFGLPLNNAVCPTFDSTWMNCLYGLSGSSRAETCHALPAPWPVGGQNARATPFETYMKT